MAGLLCGDSRGLVGWVLSTAKLAESASAFKEVSAHFINLARGRERETGKRGSGGGGRGRWKEIEEKLTKQLCVRTASVVVVVVDM